MNDTNNIIPMNTVLPPTFFDQFNVTSKHIEKCAISTLPVSLDLQDELFADYHTDHCVQTNIDLLYETLLLSHTYVPGWSAIPWEIYVSLVDIRGLSGGLSNLLISIEIKPELITNIELQNARFTTLSNILSSISTQNVSSTYDPTIHNLPYIKKVACRIYGTPGSNRVAELALAQLAQDQRISECIHYSWRHGRISSFLDGASLMELNGLWLDPIIAQQCAYLQGKIHGSTFPQLNNNNENIDAALIKNLSQWKERVKATRSFQKIKNLENPIIPSVFDMFCPEKKDKTQLYVLKQPPNAENRGEYHRLKEIILPLPQQLEHVIVPLLNGAQIAVTDSHKQMPLKESLLTSQYQLLPPNCNIKNDFICPPTRELSPHDEDMILKYLDLPRMLDEIDWILQCCESFPCVTSHSDYHSGNVLLLNSLLYTARDLLDATNNINDDNDNNNSLLTISTSSSVPQYYSPEQPLHLPNDFLQWIKVIDFEFSGYSYRGYDCANSLTESYISYEGDYPAFTMDAPGMISTHLLGIYNGEYLKQIHSITPTRSEPLLNVDGSGVNYTPFDHPAADYLSKHCPTEKINQILDQQNSPENTLISAYLQSILLGGHSNPVETDKIYQKLQNKCVNENKNIRNNISLPAFRPREYSWAKNVLTGFYHSFTAEQQQKNCIGPYYPFKNQPNYVLPDNIEEWLDDQIPNLLYESMILYFACQLLWSFWGIVVVETTQIGGFGYLEHALARMIAYVAKKELVIKLGLLRQ